MKAKIILISIVILNLFQNPTCLKAQWVTIPDANFVAYLQTNFPSCMNGNLMDTTCAGITGAISVNCGNLNIADLTGIQYFDNLLFLNCYGNNLHSLPNLPSSLITLSCSFNYLTSLPTLPNSLTSLNCNNNNLANLPALPNNLQDLNFGTNNCSIIPPLPNTIINLSCRSNHLTSLPALPPLLQGFDCAANQLTSLPSLPNSLFIVSCADNYLTSLPTLPNSDTTLSCFNNQLTTLPSLPNSLTQLICYNNLLTSLPALPNSLIQYIICSYNQLTSIPPLPNGLKKLWCEYNNLINLPSLPNSLQNLQCFNNFLVTLPALPNTLSVLWCNNNSLTIIPTLPSILTEFNCSNNQLTNLPALPNSLNYFKCNNNSITCFPTFPVSLTNINSFSITNNPFSCLPNYVAGMNLSTLSYPLCVTGDLLNNPNGCAGAEGIVGYTFQDANNNCVKNPSDLVLKNVHKKLYNNSNALISQNFSALNGVYDFPQPSGTYTVKIDTTDAPFIAQCSFPGIDSTVVLTTSNQLINNVNFSLTCKPGFDVGVRSIGIGGICFPSLSHKLIINAGDMGQWFNLNCASGISGQIIVTVIGPVIYSGIASGALTPSVSNNDYIYTIADFGAINNLSAFGLIFTTNTSAVQGNPICVSVTVTSSNGDYNLSNNSYNYCYHVVSSFDPNYKETYPETVQPGFDDYFTYTIHFQNTGNAPAININLQDTLDANLDLNTFQVINYSHYNTTWLNGNKLSVNFPNIQLPDSTSDFDGSQGFVQYRIKPLSNLPAGTQIHNTASIYFDFNAPVVTNTTTNEFLLSTKINEFNDGDVSVFPNPATNQLSVVSYQLSVKEIKIYNVLGECVEQSAIKQLNNLTIDISKLLSGVYFMEIVAADSQIVRKKFVKE